MKLAFVCFCIFAVACFHDAILLNIYDRKDVTFCFWNIEKLSNSSIHPTAASIVATTVSQHCKVRNTAWSLLGTILRTTSNSTQGDSVEHVILAVV